jgi:hypothetical protein
MLEVINLYVIDKIFENAKEKVSPMAKMLYINCLTYHFKELKATTMNAYAFSILKENIPSYNRYHKLFEELQTSGLVILNYDEIYFNNTWGLYINRDMLDIVSEDKKAIGFEPKTISEFVEEMKCSVSLKELCCVKNKLNVRQIDYLIVLFFKEQVAIGKNYVNYSDCAKHFINWIPSNIAKAPTELVKSKSKLLGE